MRNWGNDVALYFKKMLMKTSNIQHMNIRFQAYQLLQKSWKVDTISAGECLCSHSMKTSFCAKEIPW